MSTVPVGVAPGTSSCHQDGLLGAIVGAGGAVERSGGAVDCGRSSVLIASVFGGDGAGAGVLDGCGKSDDVAMASLSAAATGCVQAAVFMIAASCVGGIGGAGR